MPFHLPNEVLGVIVAEVPLSDTATLASLLCVCQATYALAAPLLYRDLAITDRNLSGVLVGLLHPPNVEVVDDSSLASEPSVATVAGPGESVAVALAKPPEAYPSPSSDARKRALLALTTTLRVRSVPPRCKTCECRTTFRVCPMDRSTFPSVKTVVVSTQVPYHHDLSARRLPDRSPAGGGGRF